MMFKKKPFLFLFITLTLSTLVVCSSKNIKADNTNVFLDEQKSNLLNYSFKIADLKNIDKTLSNQRYYFFTKNTDEKYVAVVTYQAENASTNQYLITKDGTIDVTVPKDSHFIISLPANPTMGCTWNIKNSVDNGIIEFENRSWIDMPLPKSVKHYHSISYARQNFYFKHIKAGNEKVVMRYENETEPKVAFYEITFNIKVE
jgi:predicted secreted protein